MSFYSDLKLTAARLLTDKGQQVTFSREVETAFNPTTGVVTASTTTYTGYGAAFDYSQREIDGVIVQAGDIRFLMEATTTEPKNGDTTTIDSSNYRIMNVNPTSPAGVVVMYEVQLRR